MRAGILIIGSLLWDNSGRDTWRKSRLDVEGLHVKVPIGYYRKSKSRDNTFTMTLATGELPGQGILVPCRLPMESAQDLVTEARALWKAEQPSAAADSISAAWGSVGVLFAPSVSPAWRTEWARCFQSSGRRVPPVNDAGVLEIAWPTNAAGAPVELHVILATATKAEGRRPTPIEIADAWIDQDAGREGYFLENIRLGIRTSLDRLIWKRIEERSPRWLKNPSYADAISILQTESALQTDIKPSLV